MERQIRILFYPELRCAPHADPGLARQIMQAWFRATFVLLLLIGRAPTMSAQEGPAGRATPTIAPPSNGTTTGKERLGRKWMDEQRIDNCKVPIDMRGTRPRPGSCPDQS